ncbi:MAG: ABC transporter substrate-binding protein [Candidatus Binatia bacterium]
MMYMLQPNERELKIPLVVAVKKIFLSLIVPLLLLSAAARSELAWSAGSAAEIRVVYSSFSGSSVPVWIAQERRLFTRHGLKADLVFATGQRPTQALVAGEVQFISTAASSSIPAAVAGADVVILAGASNVSPLEIFSKPDIKRPDQLRGKRLGITTFGSSTHAAARFALPKWGLKSGTDVVLLQLGGVLEVLAALGSGRSMPVSFPIRPRSQHVKPDFTASRVCASSDSMCNMQRSPPGVLIFEPIRMSANAFCVPTARRFFIFTPIGKAPCR